MIVPRLWATTTFGAGLREQRLFDRLAHSLLQRSVEVVDDVACELATTNRKIGSGNEMSSACARRSERDGSRQVGLPIELLHRAVAASTSVAVEAGCGRRDSSAGAGRWRQGRGDNAAAAASALTPGPSSRGSRATRQAGLPAAGGGERGRAGAASGPPNSGRPGSSACSFRNQVRSVLVLKSLRRLLRTGAMDVEPGLWRPAGPPSIRTGDEPPARSNPGAALAESPSVAHRGPRFGAPRN